MPQRKNFSQPHTHNIERFICGISKLHGNHYRVCEAMPQRKNFSQTHTHNTERFICGDLSHNLHRNHYRVREAMPQIKTVSHRHTHPMRDLFVGHFPRMLHGNHYRVREAMPQIKSFLTDTHTILRDSYWDISQITCTGIITVYMSLDSHNYSFPQATHKTLKRFILRYFPRKLHVNHLPCMLQHSLKHRDRIFLIK